MLSSLQAVTVHTSVWPMCIWDVVHIVEPGCGWVLNVIFHTWTRATLNTTGHCNYVHNYVYGAFALRINATLKRIFQLSMKNWELAQLMALSKLPNFTYSSTSKCYHWYTPSVSLNLWYLNQLTHSCTLTARWTGQGCCMLTWQICSNQHGQIWHIPYSFQFYVSDDIHTLQWPYLSGRKRKTL